MKQKISNAGCTLKGEKNPLSESPPATKKDTPFWKAVKSNIRLQRQTPSITPMVRDGSVPLSFGQERLWRVEQLQPDITAHNLRLVLRLRGPLEVAALENSLRTIVERHEILRTIFVVRNGQPVQVISPKADLELPVIALETLSSEQQDEEIRRLATEAVQTPFDLMRGPLLRVKLLRLSETEYVLLRSIHHIINDRWSDSVFLRELALRYQAITCGELSEPPALSIQFADFAIFQRQYLQGEVLKNQTVYWRQRLNGELPALQLPVDFVSTQSSYEGAAEYLEFPTELIKPLKRFSRESGVSLFVTLLAGFNILLYRYFGQTDMVLASPVAGRYRPETRDLIGFFNNVLLLRTDLNSNPTLQELLARVGETVLSAHEHQDLPMQQLAETLGIQGAVLSRAMFALQNVPVRPETMGEVRISSVDIEEGIANFDIFLSMREQEGRLTGIVRYKTGLFRAETIRKLLENYQATLELLLKNSAQHLDDLPHLTAPEPQQSTGRQSDSAPYAAPRTETEQRILNIWKDILKVKEVGVHADFFAVGGRSLAMIDLCTRLGKAFDCEISVAELFANPTISGMARYAEQASMAASPKIATRPLPNAPGRQKAALNRHRQFARQRHKAR